MFKKSFIIVIIQIMGSFLGLLTIYLIAGDMEPEVYSLVGVYTIITNISLTFSDLGVETTMMREALYWIGRDEKEKVREYATQAILSRFCGFVILLPILLVYVTYLNYTKYAGNYMLLLILFLVGADISALNNSMSLIVRSQGGYVFSQLANTVNNYCLKFAGIGLYFWKGADFYLYFYALSSVPLFLVYIYKLRKMFDFRWIRVKSVVKKIYDARYLWLRTDLDYVKNNADGILVSALFPASVMGSYTIFKSLEQVAKNFIEGFFDVLSQNTVKYKGNKEQLIIQEKKIKLARNLVVFLILVGTFVFALNQNFFVQLVHLNKYESINEMIFCVAIVSIIYLIGKYEINALAFFATSKLNFQMGILTSILSLLSFGWIFVFPSIYGVLLQRIFAYLVVTVVAVILFKKEKEELYTQINK